MRSHDEFDLLRAPFIGALLRKRGTRNWLQGVVLILAMAMMVHGLFGPALAPKNLATTLTWVHYRGALVLVLLAAGNFFCMACPLMLVRNTLRRVWNPSRQWPRVLRNKWPAIVLFATALFSYEYFDLWSSPLWTACLIAGAFVAIVAVDGFFKGASFCKFVCPVGQFNFVGATLSPLEVKARNLQTCSSCTTSDCIKGRHDEQNRLSQRGCELSLFQPTKFGNLDCTFCLDCVYACPHDNVAIKARLPGSELWERARRSGIGRLSERPDLAALVTLFVFGALLNVLGMTTPVYALEAWLAEVLGTRAELPVLGIVFAVALLLEPLLLVGMAAHLTQRQLADHRGTLQVAVRYVYALVPLGFAIWLAHYAFHFLTGFFTFIPALQQALVDLGFSADLSSFWSLRGVPVGSVTALQYGTIALGTFSSGVVAYHLAAHESVARPWRVASPWIVLAMMLGASALWLLTQPMEMRGTFVAG